MTTEKLNPAQIILQQLGGSGRLKAMVKGRDFIACDDGQTLQFKFSGNRKMNCVRITLNAMDLYDVEFIKVLPYKPGRKLEDMAKTKAEYENVPAENLRFVWKEATGLYLTLV